MQNFDTTCIIIASRPVSAGLLQFAPAEGAYVIAVDAGWQTARTLGLPVNLALGDYDSAAPPPVGFAAEQIILPAEKDDTDTHFAAKEAIRRGFGHAVLLGALGGRLDQSAATLATLLYLSRAGVNALALGEGTEVRCTGPGEVLRVPARAGAYLSVLPADGPATGVTLRGVKYPLSEAAITPDYPLGVSNEFRGPEAEVSCTGGWLFAMTVLEEAP